jgi:hypothetical protein
MTANKRETLGVKMMQEVDAPSCGRENDLVTFLYGELSDVETESFESHMHTCRPCQAQTSEFRAIRESVAAWRDEALGRAEVTSSPNFRIMNQRKASGLAALRAFFDLSPLWMKGAIGVAAILFCIFTVLAVAQLSPAPVPAVTTIEANTQGYSQQQMNALVEQRVQEELARLKSLEEPSRAPSSVREKQRTGIRSRVLSSQSYDVASAARNGKARRPLSKTEREQLAADLRLTSAVNEHGVDLVDDQINQP